MISSAQQCFFLSSTGEQKAVQSNTQMNVQENQKVVFQVKEPSTAKMTECAHKKGNRAEAAQEDNQKKPLVKDNGHQLHPAHTVADKGLKTGEEHKNVDILLQQGRQVNKTRFKTTDHISAVSTMLSGDARVKEKQDVIKEATKSKDSASMRGQSAAEGNKQQSLRKAATEGKAIEGSQVDGKHVGTHLTIGHMSTPITRLQPLGVKDSCDDMQSMEIR